MTAWSPTRRERHILRNPQRPAPVIERRQCACPCMECLTWLNDGRAICRFCARHHDVPPHWACPDCGQPCYCGDDRQMHVNCGRYEP